MNVNIIQFLHPDEEHGVDDRKKMIMYWNQGPHKRKFLKARGQYVTASGTLPEQVPLLFWGEWEPNSHVVKEFSFAKQQINISQLYADQKPSNIYLKNYRIKNKKQH